MATEPDRLVETRPGYPGGRLVLLPVISTFVYYRLPPSIQEQTLAQIAPQLLAYLGLFLWATSNDRVMSRLGLDHVNVRSGVRWGFTTGLLLGCLNTFVILSVYPHLGYDITFLRSTLHGRLPVVVMVPWFICAIAILVELNFRGFLLGRLAELESTLWRSNSGSHFQPLALIISAMTFTFDPFLVNTFQDLHWIALWDGLIWGTLWVRTRNLYLTIVAHAVEVLILYSAVRAEIG